MPPESDNKASEFPKNKPWKLGILAIGCILIIAIIVLVLHPGPAIQGENPVVIPPLTPAPDPRESSIAEDTTATLSPEKSGAVPVHVLEYADKPSNLISLGSLQFRISGGPSSSITHGGILYNLNAGDTVRLVIGSDTRGKIAISSERISTFAYDDVHLFINGDDKGSATVDSIMVNGYFQMVSTLILDTPAVPAWTRLDADGVANIPGISSTNRIQLINIQPYQGNLTLDNIVNTRYDGGADSYEITAATAVPVANFTGSPVHGIRPLTVRFTDHSSGNPTTWLWDFGDSNMTSSTLQNPVHLYQNAGNYTVRLTAKNAAGSNTVTKAGYISANLVTPPSAGFTASPTNGDQGLLVRFTDTSSNNPSSWLWEFGDGMTSTEQNPSHTYEGSGVFSVTLTASNAGGSSTVTRAGYISTGSVKPPVTGFTATPTTGSAGVVVRFSDTSGNTPTAWFWEFGDGGNSTLQNPAHAYTEPGTYSVRLTASNAGGSDMMTQDGYITVTVPPPYARFTGSPISGTIPLTVSFTDNSNNTPTSWLWDFGDGSTSDKKDPVHTYTTQGAHSVTLTSANAGGSSTVTRNSYIVANMITPTASFTAKPVSGIAPFAVQFTDTSTYYPTSWLWDFGDGGISSLQNPSHTYTVPGTYTVTLKVSNPVGSSSSSRANCVSVGNA